MNIINDESNEKINSYIKNREQDESIQYSVLQSTTPEPITLIHDEYNK